MSGSPAPAQNAQVPTANPAAPTPAPAPAAPHPSIFDIFTQSLGVVAQAAPEIQAVSRMSPRSQATFQLTIGLLGALSALLAHAHQTPPPAA